MNHNLRVLTGNGSGDSPLRRGVYILPNLFTTGGLFAGFYSVIQTLGEHYELAAVMILVAHMFDGLDGRIARLTRTTSKFGVEYDSLADLIAFGVAPGILVYQWALAPWGTWGWLAASLYVTCGALRLARFNVQVESVEKRAFVGLPIPAAADMVAATVLLYYFLGGEGETHKHVILLGLIYALATLMVSSVPFYSFKDLRWRRRQPFGLLIALIVVIMLTIGQPQLMLFTGVFLYILSGPVWWLWRKLHRPVAVAPAATAEATARSDRRSKTAR
ncbi:MAG: CDP-diacylglycerol---serine O-phosphatidyltransferase [Candidatus Binatota bacterium]|jgi:CDP-diacylglycerol--serine O-phosphatidyltransferase|nr:CDP-diacylglycerol---serine O-phosphatidyltransferase [Candidatus Binatota bacterium]